MLKSNQEEWLLAAKEIASCLGVNIHDLISKTAPILELCPVPVRPAVEVLLLTFDMVSEVQDQFSQSLRLIARSAKLLKGIRDQTDGLDDLVLPPRLSMNIHTFENLLIDIQGFIQCQIKRGWFKRFLFRHKIRSHLDDFNIMINEVAQEFEIRSHLSIHKRLTEVKVDRMQDSSQIRSMISDALDNDEVLLHQLQLQRSSIQSLEQTLYKHIAISCKYGEKQIDDQRIARRTKSANIFPKLSRLSSFVKPMSSNAVVYDRKYLSSMLKKVSGFGRIPGSFN